MCPAPTPKELIKHSKCPHEWNEIDFQVQEAKRLMGLEVHQDGVEKSNSLAWWRTVATSCAIKMTPQKQREHS